MEHCIGKMIYAGSKHDEESDSDGDAQQMFYIQRSRFGRDGARNRLNRQYDQSFVHQMLGDLDSGVVDSEPQVEDKPRFDFDSRGMLVKSIGSWRYQRHLLSSATSKWRGSNARARYGKDNTGNETSGGPRTKFRQDASSLQLNEFLTSLESKIRGAVVEVQGVPKLNAEPTEDSIVERPSQMIKLHESDAGTAQDELHGARRKILEKLSKGCASWIENNSLSSHTMEQGGLKGAKKKDGPSRLDDCEYCPPSPVGGTMMDGLTLLDSIYQLGSADDLGTTTSINCDTFM